MAAVEVVSEREVTAGWIFVIQVLDDDGGLGRHDVRLSWADYALWSASGADEPASVAAAVVHYLLSRAPAGELRSSFDASISRRLHEDADNEIPGFIRP